LLESSKVCCDLWRGMESQKLEWTDQAFALHSSRFTLQVIQAAIKQVWQKKIRPRLRAAKSFCLGRER